jgi:thioredoxin-like negative regulator of GroEL
MIRVCRARLTLLGLLAFVGCAGGAVGSPPAAGLSDASALSFFQLAQEEAQKDRLVEAEAALRKALQLTPNAEPVLYSLGVVLEQLRDFDQAKEVLNRLPDSPRKTAALRRARLRAGEPAAIKELEGDYAAALSQGDFVNAGKLGRSLAAVYSEFGGAQEAACLTYELNQY